MLFIAVFFILLLILFLFVIKIKAAIRYIRNELDEWVKFSFYTREGTIRYEYKVPLVKKEGNKVKFKLVKGQSKESKDSPEKNEKLGPFDIIKKINSVRTYLKDHKSILEDTRKYLNKHNISIELELKIKQGTGDAAQTGIVCGLLWSAAGILNAYITRHLKTIKTNINITPCFNKSIFEVDAACIFHVKLVHIIVVLIKIYYMKYQIRIKSKNTLGGEVSG